MIKNRNFDTLKSLAAVDARLTEKEKERKLLKDVIDMLDDFQRGVDANFVGSHNDGNRGWLKIQIRNIKEKLK